MSTAIFLRTYYGDWRWLVYALESLRKYAHSQSEIVITCPQEDLRRIKGCVDLRKVRITPCEKYHADDYIGQQITKLQADTFCPGADHILFWDSDCLATRNFNVAEFFNEAGKPMHTYRAWEDAGTAICWRDITANILGHAPAYEFMAQLPIIHAAETLRGFRDLIEKQSDQNFYTAMAGAKALSEFNALGSYAHTHRRDAYDWRKAGPDDGYPRPAKQFWSRGGFTPATEAEINRILA